jgi:predicted NAD-dependent protein-ADP-ribosyltransferase YbiA (DUF1768 family)
MGLSKPNPQKVIINGKSYDYLGFYFPGKNTDWDNVFGVPYFGNFWLETIKIQLKGTITATFHTSEAAYQASKWWNDTSIRNSFENAKDGKDAFDIKSSLDDNKVAFNGAYGGFSRGEEAMFEILKEKFGDNHPQLKAALGSTGNAYLLEHSPLMRHQDRVWSDGYDGYGTNHLGIGLMQVREHYFPGQGNPVAEQDNPSAILACRDALCLLMKSMGLHCDQFPKK